MQNQCGYYYNFIFLELIPVTFSVPACIPLVNYFDICYYTERLVETLSMMAHEIAGRDWLNLF